MGTQAPLHVQHKKLDWFYAPCFTAFWIVLYMAVVLQQVNHLPTPLTLQDEFTQPDSFITERAENVLLNLTNLGPRVVGSEANEVEAVTLILDQVFKVQNEMNQDYFDIEVDLQVVSGQYMHTSLYHGVQNILAKLSAKNNTSTNYLLINSHFDSTPKSPGASDDGAMVAVMLEILRVMANSKGPLEHPIVFLFNGAEEDGLLASYGFTTQHKWAKNCKVIINLDAAGSGGREILFQSISESSWLMNYYSKVTHPFANAVLEELFQFGLVPSATDFRNFRDYGGMQGFDMAYIQNGYVYHTEFDSFKVYPKASLQNTGDNVLSLAKSLGNAPEMRNINNYGNMEHFIFFDFLGWFMVHYTMNTNLIVNILVCVAALIAIVISLCWISKRADLSLLAIVAQFMLTTFIQTLSLALGAAFSILISYVMDVIGCSMTWFSNNWLICGLYFCPVFFFLGILPAGFLEYTKKYALPLGLRIQLFLHSHCLILIVLTISLTFLNIRSAFMFMVAVFFYAAALIGNLITQLHNKGSWFAIPVIVSQIVPFLYFSYVAEYLYFIFIPVTGRNGGASNPDLLIALIAVIFAILLSGFLIPLYLLFRRTRSIILCSLGVAILFMILAIRPIGTPYTPKLAPQRYTVQHANQLYHNADGSIRSNESAIYLYQQDRHIDIAEEVIVKFKAAHETSTVCNNEATCQLDRPSIFYTPNSLWLPVNEPPGIPYERPVLTLTAKTIMNTPNTVRYNYTLTGPDHMMFFIEPKTSAKIINWSFDKTILSRKELVFTFVHGKNNDAFEFFIDLECHQYTEFGNRVKIYEEFLESLPNYATNVNWLATYDSWLF
uniref:FXNA-like protease n=1 Tax=Ceratitis capitata TaxID=7213 RepID=W8B895_CERCA